MKVTPLVLCATLCVGAAVPSPADAATRLKIATLAPEGSYWMEAMRAGADEISRRTDGRVDFRFYPGGTMGNDQAVMRKIRIGQLHGGAVLSGTLATQVPNLDLYALPLFFESYDEVDAVRTEYDPRLLDELERAGYVSFGFIEGGFAYLMSVKPVRTVSDLKGQKAWFPEGDAIGRSILQAAGLSPVPLPLSDVLTGLQTGLVEAIAGPPVGAVALQWFTKARYMTEIPIVYSFGSLVISSKAFGRLGRDDQQIVREVLTEVVRDLDVRARADNRSAREALIEQGVEMLPVSPEFESEWRKIASQATASLRSDLDIDPGMWSSVDRRLAELREDDGS